MADKKKAPRLIAAGPSHGYIRGSPNGDEAQVRRNSASAWHECTGARRFEALVERFPPKLDQIFLCVTKKTAGVSSGGQFDDCRARRGEPSSRHQCAGWLAQREPRQVAEGKVQRCNKKMAANTAVSAAVVQMTADTMPSVRAEGGLPSESVGRRSLIRVEPYAEN